MAWIVADSFDYYGSTADLPHSVWDAMPGAPNFVSGASTRFGIGQAMENSSGIQRDIVVKNAFGTNESTVYLVFALFMENAPSGSNPTFHIRLQDGGTNQCSVGLESDGAIRLRSGSGTGTILATYPSALPQTVWTHFQIRIVIDPAAGSITIRKNGSVADTWTATGLNTRGGTANSYANGLTIGHATATNWGWRLDDFLCFGSSGAAPNTWVGDVRGICLMADNDTAQKNFAPFPGSTASTPGSFNTSFTNTPGVNTLCIGQQVVPTHGGPVTSAVATGQSAQTGHVQLAIYASDASGGLPGTLLGTSAVVTNPPTGAVTFTFTPSVPLAAGVGYYFALLQDVGWTVAIQSGLSGNFYTATRSYASGFPNPAGAVSVGSGNPPGFVGTQSGNCTTVGELLANGDTDYVASSNPGDADLYALAPLPIVPYAIVGVVSKVYLRKSDAGARQGQMLMKSGTTTVNSPDLPLASTYTYVAHVDPVDPNTSATWTQAGVNAMQVGVKVTS